MSVRLSLRKFGPAGRGVAAAAVAVLTLLPVAVGLGLPLVIRRQATRAEGCAPELRSIRLLALVAVGPCAGIGVLLASQILGEVGGNVVRVFIVGCCLSPVTVLWICDANILLAHHRLAAYSLTNVTPPTVLLAGALAGWVIGVVSVEYVILLNVSGALATLVLTSSLVRISVTGARAPVRPLVREGLSYAGSQISEAASMRLDQAIALPIIGATQAGYYAVAAAISLVPYAIGQALGAAIYRHVAVTEDETRRASHMTIALRYSTVVTAVATLFIACLVPWCVPFLFGEDFRDAVAPTLLALCGSVAVSVGYVSSGLLAALGRGWAMTRAQLAGLGIGIGMLLALGPSLGAIGAAVASSFGFVCATLLSVRAIGVPVGRFEWRDLRGAVALFVRGRFDDVS